MSLRRILMTADTLGGVWTYALELARGLARHDVQVTLVVMGGALNPRQRQLAAEVPDLELRESRYRLEWMDEPWQDVEAAGRWLLELEAECVPDVVHLNGYAHAALPWRAPALIAAHSCVYSWWEAVHGSEPPARYRRYADAVGTGLHAADRVVAPTRAMGEALRRHYGAPVWTEIIHNGITPSYYAPVTKRPMVFAAGRLWDEAKNLETLAAVAPTLRWPVHLAGDLQHPNGRVAHFPQVNVLGHLSPDILQRWLSQAAIYAAPARYEPFGLGVLEAACHGCALVLGDIPSLRELWQDAAVFVAPDDQAGLVEAINGLASDTPHRARMGEKARRHARHFGSHRMVEAYRNLYADLATLPAPRGAGPRTDAAGDSVPCA